MVTTVQNYDDPKQKLNSLKIHSGELYIDLISGLIGSYSP